MNTDALKSLGSRAGWTALQAGLGVAITWWADNSDTIDVTDDPGLAVLIVSGVATALSAVKSFVASKVGDPDTVEFK